MRLDRVDFGCVFYHYESFNNCARVQFCSIVMFLLSCYTGANNSKIVFNKVKKGRLGKR